MKLRFGSCSKTFKNHCTREMWQKDRDKKNVEGQSRYPLFNPNKQQGKEGSAQSQEKTQENGVESINSGCPDLDRFITEDLS